MIGEDALHVLRFCLVLFVVWLVWYQFWIPYRVDYFRQRLFELRDELFEYAKAGNREFTDPAYVNLRRAINALIRYGHRVTISKILIGMVVLKNSGRSPMTNAAAEWEKHVAAIEDEETKRRMSGFGNEMLKTVLTHTILISPMTIAAIVFMAIYLRMVAKVVESVESMAKSWSAARKKIELFNVELATVKARSYRL